MLPYFRYDTGSVNTKKRADFFLISPLQTKANVAVPMDENQR
jgi:hypothetical protein